MTGVRFPYALGVAALLLCAPAFAAAPDALPPKAPPIPKPLQIEVLHASYGAHDDLMPCDVSASIKSACNNRYSCAVPVTDDLCTMSGTRPLIPTLKVFYRCSAAEATRIKAADKPFTLRLACVQGRR